MNDLSLTAVVPGQAPPPPFSRKSVIAERYDLGLSWFAAVVLGALVITFIPEQRGAYRAFFPLLFMLAFAAFALNRERFSKAKVADSIYFMGFIWTLWALIDVLVGKPQLTSRELYSAFGYALTATAGGTFMRLMVLQFFRTFEDQEREAVDAIDQRVARLVAELESAQQSLADLRGHATSALGAWHRDFATASKSHVDLIGQTAQLFAAEGTELTNAVRGIRTSVSVTGRAFSDAEKKLTDASQKIGVNLTGAVTNLEGAMSDMSRRITMINIPPDVFTSAVAEPLKNVDAAIAPFRQLALNTIGDLNRATKEVADTIKSLPNSNELQRATLAAINNLIATANATQKLAAESVDAARVLTTVKESMQQAQNVVLGAGSRVSKDANEVAVVMQQAGRSAKEASEVIKDVVRFVQSEIPPR